MEFFVEASVGHLHSAATPDVLLPQFAIFVGAPFAPPVSPFDAAELLLPADADPAYVAVVPDA